MTTNEAITILEEVKLIDDSLYQYNEKYLEALDMAIQALKNEKTDRGLITEIDKLPRIKVGNSNSPTVKYCIDEVLLYDLLDNFPSAEKTAQWIIKHKVTNSGSFWEIKCSNCEIESDSIYRYCPQCGAKMNEGEEEE